MEEMDSIFHDDPSVHTDNVVSVGVETNPTPAINISMDLVQETVKETRNFEESNSNDSTNTPQSSKCRNKNNLLQIKKEYYENKIVEKRKTREMLERYLNSKELSRGRRHKELLEALKNNTK